MISVWLWRDVNFLLIVLWQVATSEIVLAAGWEALFNEQGYAGRTLDVPNFIEVSRKVLNLSKHEITDMELRELHGVMDTDEDSMIDKFEILDFLRTGMGTPVLNFEAFYSSALELSCYWADGKSESAHAGFLGSVFLPYNSQ